MSRSLIGFIASAALVGCSSGSGEVKLGVDVAALQTSTAGTAAVNAWSEAGLAVTRVRILVEEAKIGYTSGRCTGASAQAGPYVVELTADEITTGAHREFSLGELASGTYGGAEIEIKPLHDASAAATDAALDDFKAAGASLLIDGTFGGEGFQFAGHFLAEQGTDGKVFVDESVPVSLAMSVDPSTWFLNAEGAVVDPTDAAQHDAIAIAICKALDTEPQLAPTGRTDGTGGHAGPKGHAGPGGQGHCIETTTR